MLGEIREIVQEVGKGILMLGINVLEGRDQKNF